MRDVDLSYPLHPLLAFLLLLKKLAFTADVAAVTFGDDVFADGGYGFACDDFAADGRLNGDLEHLTWNQFAHLRDQSFAAIVGEVPMDDDGECVDGLTGDEDIHLDHWRGPGAGEVIVE